MSSRIRRTVTWPGDHTALKVRLIPPTKVADGPRSSCRLFGYDAYGRDTGRLLSCFGIQTNEASIDFRGAGTELARGLEPGDIGAEFCEVKLLIEGLPAPGMPRVPFSRWATTSIPLSRCPNGREMLYADSHSGAQCFCGSRRRQAKRTGGSNHQHLGAGSDYPGLL